MKIFTQEEFSVHNIIFVSVDSIKALFRTDNYKKYNISQVQLSQMNLCA